MIPTADMFIDRLKTQLVPATLPSVDGALSLMGALDQLKRNGETFVVPSGEIAGPNTAGTSVLRQKVDYQVSVVFGLMRAGAAGGSSLTKIDDFKEAIKAALVGWQPDADSGNIVSYVRGKLAAINIDKGIFFWGCDFSCPYYVRV